MVKDGEYPKEVLTADRGGELALPVFSGEGEAELFLWLGRGPEDGWRVRETSAGELVSVLYGPYAGAGRVALDPSPKALATGPVGPVSVCRKRFASWIAGRTVRPPALGTSPGDEPGGRKRAATLGSR